MERTEPLNYKYYFIGSFSRIQRSPEYKKKRDAGSIPGSGRSLGEGRGTPLQYSCLENPMDGGAWWATVYWVTQRWT